jgi:hypothetical protein
MSRRGQSEGTGAGSEGVDMLTGMVQLSLGERHQRVRTVSQNVDRVPDGAEILVLPVNTEAAVPAQDSSTQPAFPLEHLPGRHVIKGTLQPVGHVEEDVRIGIRRMIGHDEDSFASIQCPPQGLQTTNIYVMKPLVEPLPDQSRRPDDSDPEGA